MLIVHITLTKTLLFASGVYHVSASLALAADEEITHLCFTSCKL